MASSTDRKWMYEKTDSDGFLSSEYCDNVDSFLDFAFSNEAIVDTRVNRHGTTIREIKCPCYKCQNISYRDRATVQKHLYKEGFMLRYERWTEHGESSIRYVGQSSTAMELDDNDDGYKRMVLDNMYACGYTSDTLEGDVPNPEAKAFYDMLEALDEPLWEGEKATNCSKLQVAMRFLTWKSMFNVSNAAKLGRLKRMIKNKGKIEGSIVQSNLVDELSNYCSLYLEPTIRGPRNFSPGIPCSSSTDLRLSIFKHPSRRLYEKGGVDKVLSQKDRDKAHIYILLNCEELLDSVGLFDKELRDLFPSYDEATLDKMKEDEFAKWLLMHVMNVPNKEHLRGLAQGPLTYVKSHKGYFVNGYRFHTRTAYDGRVTQNSGVCVKGATYNENENDYYGLLDEILELEYHSTVGRCVVVLFRCTWFDPVRGVRVDPKTNMVDVKPTAIGCVDDPFILASQAQQVYYTSYPSKEKELKGWLAVVKTTPRGVYELAEDVIEVEDDGNAEKDHFYQETERIECTVTDDLHHPISFVHEDGSLEEVEEGDFYDSDEEVDRNDKDSEDEESE
ncbi:hypothetical protein SSX86_023454 [Deinandra increscens subsp. villosa]|uniref:Transposase n=1 Tax=Deinandra increscens subsp. villosa TaxID=3103831 RepID=A0AAP0CR24_9ASTR